jgi:hypothetical protein
MALEQFSQRFHDLPETMVPFGYDAEGLPMLFDLGSGYSDPLVVIGDPHSGKTRFLLTFLCAAMNNLPAEEFNFLVISTNPEEYRAVNQPGSESGHCLGVIASDDAEAGEWILRLAETAEERLDSLDISPALVLVLDDLQFLPNLDTDIRLNLEWLLRNGQLGHVWVIGAIPTSAAISMSRYICQFRTRILGKMPAKNATRLGLYPGLDSSSLVAGRQFAVYLNQNWLNFFLPMIDFQADQTETKDGDE